MRNNRHIRDFIDKPVVKVITGMRRCGKSVILKQIQDELLDRGVPKERIFYVNFESLRYEEWRDYKALYGTVTNAVKEADGRLYIFIDEVQEVEMWEKAINSFRVDFDCDIYVTGSNAKFSAKTLVLRTEKRLFLFMLHFVSDPIWRSVPIACHKNVITK